MAAFWGSELCTVTTKLVSRVVGREKEKPRGDGDSVTSVRIYLGKVKALCEEELAGKRFTKVTVMTQPLRDIMVWAGAMKTGGHPGRE